MAHKDPDGTVELTPTEARQASPRQLNLRVLVFSLLLALIVAGGLYFVFRGDPALKGQGPKSGQATQQQAPPKSQ
ncbi:MAG: hypothetical protein JSS20_10235 [Proteobacteria bacterium]|nr:hypothetical protein [Pseudomonadota bacterium]